MTSQGHFCESGPWLFYISCRPGPLLISSTTLAYSSLLTNTLPDQSHVHLIATMILCNNNIIVLSEFHGFKKTFNTVDNGVLWELKPPLQTRFKVCLKNYIMINISFNMFFPHKNRREKTGARSVCNGFQVECCATGLKVRFFLRSYPIRSDMYINPAVLKRQCICITHRTQQGVQHTTVSIEITFLLHVFGAERTLDICICMKNLWAMVQDFCIGSHQLAFSYFTCIYIQISAYKD